MFLSNFSVKKPIATVVIIVAMMAIGLLALSKLKVNQNPDVEIPIIVVNIPYPGASPETAEREITDRLDHLAWLAGEGGFLDTTAAMLEPMERATTPHGRATLQGDTRANAVRERFNALQKEISARGDGKDGAGKAWHGYCDRNYRNDR